MITLELVRYAENGESTLGILSLIRGPAREFLCYVLEDAHHQVKIYGQTRIPAGQYPVTLRKEGRFHARNLKRYGPKWHKGQLWVRDIPNYQFVLIHCGNDRDDTKGCLLTGSTANHNHLTRGMIGGSRKAYKYMYPKIRDEILAGGDVTLHISDMGAGS